jgi:nucleotide-binding universal stress UspA family protein
MYRSLLVALAPGSLSDAPARYAIALAQREHLRLQGLTVIDPDRMIPAEAVPLGGDAYKAKRDEEMLQKVRQAANETLAAFCEQGKGAGVHCEAMASEGDLPVVLATAAERADALIVGHGTGRPIAGEVAHLHVLHGILTHCVRPVLVAPKTARATNTALVAYDGSPHAARALQAFATSGLYHAHDVHVLTIHDDTTAGDQVAQRAVDYLRAHEMAVEGHVENPQEDIAQQILGWARRTESGLLVMGAHGHSRLRELLLGSTTHTILDASEIPVLLEH